MNPPHADATSKALLEKDAIFFSPHKFAGGPQAVGVLVYKKSLCKRGVSSAPGGGEDGLLVLAPPDFHQPLLSSLNARAPCFRTWSRIRPIPAHLHRHCLLRLRKQAASLLEAGPASLNIPSHTFHVPSNHITHTIHASPHVSG